MLSAPLSAVRVEPHDRKIGQYRYDFTNAEFGSLLHDDIHAVAARNALQKPNGERRFAEVRLSVANAQSDAPFADSGNRRRIVEVAVVENRDRVADRHAQHSRDVVCSVTLQQDVLASRNGMLDEQPRGGLCRFF